MHRVFGYKKQSIILMSTSLFVFVIFVFLALFADAAFWWFLFVPGIGILLGLLGFPLFVISYDEETILIRKGWRKVSVRRDEIVEVYLRKQRLYRFEMSPFFVINLSFPVYAECADPITYIEKGNLPRYLAIYGMDSKADFYKIFDPKKTKIL